MSERVIAAFPFSDVSRTPEKAILERRLAELMIASLRRAMPGVEIMQITDTGHTEALPVDVVMRKPFTHKEWVPWLMEAVAEIPGNVLFLDSDIIVQRDLRPMFLADADVIVTSRGPKTMEGRFMPFLLGVVASKTPEFWLDMRDRVLAMKNEDDRGWWGGQLALFDAWMDQENGCLPWKMAAVPCDPHNYVPKAEDDAPADKWVLHYKGQKRKEWMLARWGKNRQPCTRCAQGRACWHVDCPHHVDARVAA
jgi:hypothetical protein